MSSKKKDILSLATKSRSVVQMPRKHTTKVEKTTIMRHLRQVTLTQEKKKPTIFLIQLCLVILNCLDSKQNSIDHLLKVRDHVMLRIVRTTTKN